jgi:hypothetical protein
VLETALAEALRSLECDLLESTGSGDVVDAQLILGEHRTELSGAVDRIIGAQRMPAAALHFSAY